MRWRKSSLKPLVSKVFSLMELLSRNFESRQSGSCSRDYLATRVSGLGYEGSRRLLWPLGGRWKSAREREHYGNKAVWQASGKWNCLSFVKVSWQYFLRCRKSNRESFIDLIWSVKTWYVNAESSLDSALTLLNWKIAITKVYLTHRRTRRESSPSVPRWSHRRLILSY